MYLQAITTYRSQVIKYLHLLQSVDLKYIIYFTSFNWVIMRFLNYQFYKAHPPLNVISNLLYISYDLFALSKHFILKTKNEKLL